MKDNEKKGQLRSGNAYRNKAITAQTQESYDGFASWTVISETVTIEENSQDCPIVIPTEPQYRWVTGETCIGYDKYSVSAQQVCYKETCGDDDWANTGIEYTEFLLANGCKDNPDVHPKYRWKEVDPICIGKDKYSVSAQQVCYKVTCGDDDWLNTGEEIKALVEVESSYCTDEPPSGEYRWVTSYTCVDYDYYEIKTQQKKNEETGEWEDTGGIERRLIEANSRDNCGYQDDEFKWVFVEYFCDESNCDRYMKEVLETCSPTPQCSCSEANCWVRNDEYRTTLIRENSPMCYELYRGWIDDEPIEPEEPIDPIEPLPEPQDPSSEAHRQWEIAHAQWVIDHAQWEIDHTRWEEIDHPQWEIDHKAWWEEHVEWWKVYTDYNSWKAFEYEHWKSEDKELHTVNGVLYPLTACDAYKLAHKKWKDEEPEDKESVEHNVWEQNEPPYTICCGAKPDSDWVYYEGCCEDDDCGCNLTIQEGEETMEFEGGTVVFAVGNSDCGLYAYEKEIILEDGEWVYTGVIRNPDTKIIGERKVIEEHSSECCQCPIEEGVMWVVSGTTCKGTDLYELLVKLVNNGEFDEEGNLKWEIAEPEETDYGELIEANSSECGFMCGFTLRTNAVKVMFSYPDTKQPIMVNGSPLIKDVVNGVVEFTSEENAALPTPIQSVRVTIIDGGGLDFSDSSELIIYCNETKDWYGSMPKNAIKIIYTTENTSNDLYIANIKGLAIKFASRTSSSIETAYNNSGYVIEDPCRIGSATQNWQKRWQTTLLLTSIPNNLENYNLVLEFNGVFDFKQKGNDNECTPTNPTFDANGTYVQFNNGTPMYNTCELVLVGGVYLPKFTISLAGWSTLPQVTVWIKAQINS